MVARRFSPRRRSHCTGPPGLGPAEFGAEPYISPGGGAGFESQAARDPAFTPFMAPRAPAAASAQARAPAVAPVSPAAGIPAPGELLVA